MTEPPSSLEPPSQPEIGADEVEPCVRRRLEAALLDAQEGEPVLVVGATGTGKELVARALHARGGGGAGPYVVADCATDLAATARGYLAAPADPVVRCLEELESKFHRACGGTLVLDEVGLLHSEVQAPLAARLRALASHRAVGPSRIVATTSVDPEDAALVHVFDRELLELLGRRRVILPLLRARPAAIGPLARAFVRRAALSYGWPAPPISHEAQQSLLMHRWPGNVRELRHAMEYALVVSRGGPIRRSHLPEAVQTSAASIPVATVCGSAAAS